MIKATGKVHLYYFVFKVMMMMTVVTLVLMLILGCSLLAEFKYYVNKQIPGAKNKFSFLY